MCAFPRVLLLGMLPEFHLYLAVQTCEDSQVPKMCRTLFLLLCHRHHPGEWFTWCDTENSAITVKKSCKKLHCFEYVFHKSSFMSVAYQRPQRKLMVSYFVIVSTDDTDDGCGIVWRKPIGLWAFKVMPNVRPWLICFHRWSLAVHNVIQIHFYCWLPKLLDNCSGKFILPKLVLTVIVCIWQVERSTGTILTHYDCWSSSAIVVN